MTPTALCHDANDAQLVEQSLAGDRRAFSEIVGRYQSLVCALTYSATGNRAHSEDLAQETFVTAWRKLRDLNEPARLRSWLCGIARNIAHGDVRRLERQPAHAADSLDAVHEIVSADPQPAAQAVSNEELALLWREVGRLPELYREPLILFYREHKSVERVAAALELTPDAVMQRLTRGRRLLRERMLAFVETTLERTNPGSEFALSVEAALPILAATSSATAAGAAAKGGAAATQGGAWNALAAFAAPLVGLFAAIGMSWLEIAQAQSSRERRFAARWLLVLWVSVVCFVASLHGINSLARVTGFERRPQDWTYLFPDVAVWFTFSLITITLIVLMLRRKSALRRAMEEDAHVHRPPVSLKARAVQTAGFLVALFWLPAFLAWQAGDRTTSGAILLGAFILGAVPLWFGRRHLEHADDAKSGGWYVAICGLLFLGLLNWRLDVWLAALRGVELDAMHRALPMALIHGMSGVAVAWTAALVFITQPDPKR